MASQPKYPPVVYASVSARILLNVEALNMAETVGNVARHRKAPVVVASKQSGVSVVYVPAISGESLAYHYQRLLSAIAQSRGLPVTEMDKQGYYMKFASDDIVKKYYQEVESKFQLTQLKDPCKVEEAILKSSVVADVGGFLYTDKLVKRVSRVKFGYMVPTLDAIESGATAAYPQLHVRYTPRAEEREQALYYVETASALYGFTAALNASDVAELSPGCGPSVDLLAEKKKRVEAAFDALIAMLDGLLFGAKKSRFNPIWEVLSLAVSVSRGPVEFNVSPPHTRDFLVESVERAGRLVSVFKDMQVHVYWFSKEGLPEPQSVQGVTVEKATSHTDAMVKAKSKLLELLAPGR
ncbi:type I-A CRISPR-associated protein Cas7/Csa2 [Thermogladius sp.]|uniref:type I-A CRISPR-associated protein Cas7/Csa2 n=1 Tax=Thermogladius sp. TaxID=2023064 RepID=UPI003D117737